MCSDTGGSNESLGVLHDPKAHCTLLKPFTYFYLCALPRHGGIIYARSASVGAP